MVFGPSLPEPKPEEIAMQKIKKFEEQFARRLLAEVEVSPHRRAGQVINFAL